MPPVACSERLRVALCLVSITFTTSPHCKTGGTAMNTTLDTKQYPVTHTEAEWKKILSPEQFRIMRAHGTEPPGSCALNYEKRAGTFYSAGCEQALSAPKKKFE